METPNELILKGIFDGEKSLSMFYFKNSEFYKCIQRISHVAGRLEVSKSPSEKERTLIIEAINPLIRLTQKDEEDAGAAEYNAEFESVNIAAEEAHRQCMIHFQEEDYSAAYGALRELLGLIEGALSNRVVWLCTEQESIYLHDSIGKTADLLRYYPDIRVDLQEGVLCYSLGRGTASVAHMMRILEIAFKELASHFSDIAISSNPSWDSKLKKLKNAIDLMSDTSEQEEYYAIYGFLSAIKNAWRNPTMHLDRIYSAKEAKEIVDLTFAFLGMLGKKLPHLSQSSAPNK